MSRRPYDAALSRRSRVRFAALGAGALAAAVLTPVAVSGPFGGGSAHYTATFGRAGQGLDAGKSDVKVRGITVGTVEAVTLRGDGRVNVRMRVDDARVRLPRDTAAAIEPVSVFGPKDVTLDLGAGAGPYLDDGGRIDRTSDPSDLTETAGPAYRLASMVDPQDVAALLHTFGQGLAGQGPALRRTVDNGARVIDAAHRDREVLRGLLTDLAAVSGTLGDRGGAITEAAANLNALSAVTGRRPDRVSALLDGAGRLADHVGGQLATGGDDMGRIIDGTGRTAAVIADGNRTLPGLADSLTGLFSGLAGAINLQGPRGTQLVNAGYLVPLDLCYNLVDVCGALSPMHPRPPARTP